MGDKNLIGYELWRMVDVEEKIFEKDGIISDMEIRDKIDYVRDREKVYIDI